MTDHDERYHRDEAEAFIAWVAAHYTPPSLTSAQRVAFDRALAERIARRGQTTLHRSVVGIAAVSCATVLLWVAARSFDPIAPTAEQPRESVVEEVDRSAANEAALLVLAYDSAELYSDDGEEENFLPPEYAALAAALDLPGDR
ncbi:MAG: hypothetical protein NZ578_05440 [Candidatus Binatia bacterium]|nr:hypothetical protein [Candidatus Binatia bacterium]